jgi:gamma-glutamyltranspeptidase/glutathione hydrolase
MMKRRTLPFLSLFVLSLIVGLAPLDAQGKKQRPSAEWNVTGKNGAAVAGPEAAAAAVEIMKAGGNAADGAAAAVLVMQVTEGLIVNFGGEAPMVYYDAGRKRVEVLVGMGAAPRLATREYYAKIGGIPGRGNTIAAAAVPATLSALVTLLDRYGTKTFGEVAQPMLRLLDQKGKAWHGDLAVTVRRLIEAEKGDTADRRRGLRLVADYFYRGPLARELDAYSRANGGLLRYNDLATHETHVEDPASATYRGYTVYKCGPWTQGPYLLESLKLLEGFDIKSMGQNKADEIHVLAEAMKLAMADRDVYYADPRFVDVPLKELLSKEYADLRRPLIDMKHASLEQRPGDPRRMKALLDKHEWRHGPGNPSKDTSTCVVADRFGNVVAITPSGFAGTLFGKTGVWVNSRLQSFNTWEGHPNCVMPGKIPRITLTPGLVLKDGKPALVISAAGGDQQDQALLQVLVNLIDFGMSPAEAVTSPRFGTLHHLGSFGQAAPQLGDLRLDPRVGEETINELKARGAKVSMLKGPWARPVVIRINPENRTFEAAGDPKAFRYAAAY